MFILATAASCVGNTKLIQILHKILNQILIATEMTLKKTINVIVNLMSVYQSSYNFSYTVAKGVHFCKDCLCKLSDLKIGGTHTPHPVAKYEEFSQNKTKF